MKVEIEIPDWCAERHLFLMAGIELAAYKEAQEERWHVKSERCNRCGKCCQQISKDGQYPADENGDCANLIPDGDLLICALGAMRPLSCGEGDPVKSKWKGAKGFCCIRYDGEP